MTAEHTGLTGGRRRPVAVSLTETELASVCSVLALVLNDPDWFADVGNHAAIVRAHGKLIRAMLRE